MDVALGRGVSVFLNRMCCLGTQRQPSPQTASFIIIININIIIIIITIGIIINNIIVEEKEGVKGRENSILDHSGLSPVCEYHLFVHYHSIPPPFLHILAQFLNYLHNSIPFLHLYDLPLHLILLNSNRQAGMFLQLYKS